MEILSTVLAACLMVIAATAMSDNIFEWRLFTMEVGLVSLFLLGLGFII